MLSLDLWSEIRLMAKLGKRIKVIARELDISKNTVKKALRQKQYQPYQRKNATKGLLTTASLGAIIPEKLINGKVLLTNPVSEQIPPLCLRCVAGNFRHNLSFPLLVTKK